MILADDLTQTTLEHFMRRHEFGAKNALSEILYGPRANLTRWQRAKRWLSEWLRRFANVYAALRGAQFEE